jgi:hypothetical protein
MRLAKYLFPKPMLYPISPIILTTIHSLFSSPVNEFSLNLVLNKIVSTHVQFKIAKKIIFNHRKISTEQPKIFI